MLYKSRPRERIDRGRFCHGQLRELYEADFHKPGIYGSGRVRANAWDVSRRAPFRGGRGRRAVVDIVVCFGLGGLLIVFVLFDFFSSNAASMRPPCLIYISTSTGVSTGCHYLISLPVCVCVCVTLNSSFLLIARAVQGRFPQTRYLWKRASAG